MRWGEGTTRTSGVVCHAALALIVSCLCIALVVSRLCVSRNHGACCVALVASRLLRRDCECHACVSRLLFVARIAGDAARARSFSADTFDLAGLHAFLPDDQCPTPTLQAGGGSWSEWLTVAGNAFVAAQGAAMACMDAAADTASAAHVVSSRLSAVPAYSSRAYCLALSDCRFLSFVYSFARLVDARLARGQLPSGSLPPLFGTAVSARVEDDLGGPVFDAVATSPLAATEAVTLAPAPTVAAVPKRSPRSRGAGVGGGVGGTSAVPATGVSRGKGAVTTVSLNLSSVLLDRVSTPQEAGDAPTAGRSGTKASTPVVPQSPSAGARGSIAVAVGVKTGGWCGCVFDDRQSPCVVDVAVGCAGRASMAAEAAKASPARSVATAVRQSAGECCRPRVC